MTEYSHINSICNRPEVAGEVTFFCNMADIGTDCGKFAEISSFVVSRKQKPSIRPPML